MYVYKSRPFGRRSRVRSDCRVPVDYMVGPWTYRDFIENISQTGVFIGPGAYQPSCGDEIAVTFTLNSYVMVQGVVVRTTAKGFAVRFFQPLTIRV